MPKSKSKPPAVKSVTIKIGSEAHRLACLLAAARVLAGKKSTARDVTTEAVTAYAPPHLRKLGIAA